MINKLTKEQEELMTTVRDEWINKLGNIKLDKTKVEKGLEFLYGQANLEKPATTIYVKSPLGLQYTYHLLKNYEKVINSVNLGDSVRNSVGDSVRDSVRDSVWNSVANSVRDSVRNSVRDSVWNSVRDSVGDSVRDSVWDSVWNSVASSVRDSVWDSVRDSVGDSVWDSVWNSVWNSVGDYQNMGIRGSIYDWNWVAFYDYWERNDIPLTPLFKTFKENCCESGAYDYLLYQNCAIVCEHPSKIHWTIINNRKVLHNASKPAIEWEDGYKLYFLNGTKVPEELVTTPSGKLDIEFFKKETNADIKTEFIRKFGIERMSSLGKSVDSHKNYNQDWYTKSEYELIDMSPIFESIDYAPHLKMKHQTMNMFCMEAVSPNCKTIQDALSDRNEEDMSDYETIEIK